MDDADRVWDCATGNGQAAVGLAQHFGKVLGTDVSREQIAHATPHPRVSYAVAPAENSGLESGSVNLVTVGQALHWLDSDRFYQEVHRVSKGRTIIAVWCYDLLSTTPEVVEVINDFYRETLKDYWFPERRHIEAGYSTLPFPFPEMEAPEFAMTARWDLTAMIGYLKTWSAVHNYMEREGEDPLRLMKSSLEAAWGDPGEVMAVNWPIILRVGTVDAD